MGGRFLVATDDDINTCSLADNDVCDNLTIAGLSSPAKGQRHKVLTSVYPSPLVMPKYFTTDTSFDEVDPKSEATIESAVQIYEKCLTYVPEIIFT
ncbi:hypothetical protein MRX96_056348 [Rhipicephalus microplus]